MKILSIDVGIKNLAYCLFEKSEDSPYYSIKKWDIVNLSEEKCLKCCFIEKDTICNKPAKFKKDEQCYCLKHSKKQPYQIPTSEHKPSTINKHKVNKLHEIAEMYKIPYNPKMKKSDLVNQINEHINKTYFEHIEVKKANEIDLFNIGMT